MTDNQIISEIERYLDDKTYNYAVLIDGEWGCGKTFFVNNSLKDAIVRKENEKDCPRKIRYISLYGCKSLHDIFESIAISFVKDILEKKGKKYPEKGSSIVRTLIQGFKEKVASEFDIDGLIGEVASSEKNIFIFDDLERCDCTINELFGYINGMVEHDGSKVILIANEKEIRTKGNDSSKEIQLLVASNPAIKTTSEKTYLPSMPYSQASKYISEFSESELEERRKKLFPKENYCDDYKRIKEKLIGVTLQYQPDIKKACKEIIEKSNLEDKLKSLLLSFLDNFSKTMGIYHHNNLRTFQFYISKYAYLYSRIQDIQLSDEKKGYIDNITKVIAIECFNYTVKYKANYKPYNDSGLDVYEDAFSSIDEYIKTGTFLLNDFTNEISSYIEINYISKVPSDDPANQLYHSYYSESEKWCREKIEEIKENLRQDKYPIIFYDRIILTLQVLLSLGFEATLTDDFKEMMLKNISLSSDPCYVNDEMFYVNNTEIKSKTEAIINELNEAVRNRLEDTRVKTVKEILKSDDWAAELEKYVDDNFKPGSTWSLFSLTTKDEWIRLLFNTSIENLCTFRRVFNETYNRSASWNRIDENDIVFMKGLITKCDEQKPEDIIMRNNILWFKTQLEEVVQKYSN